MQKHDKYGKVWVLSAMLRHLRSPRLTYFEDTHTVIDDLKESVAGDRVVAVHVLAPGFEEHSSRLADRVVTQEQYRDEVVVP